MDPILRWMEGTWINNIVVGFAWTWPTLETLHFLGMCMLFGALIIMDLRLMGYDRLAVPGLSVHALVPLALVGFAINLITGIMFCFGDPFRYAINISFQLKMLCLLLAGLNALLFWFVVDPVLARTGPHEDPPALAKAVGFASLLLWTGVLAFGRLIPYLGTG